MRYNINVDAAAIAEGIPGQCYACPVQRALSRYLPLKMGYMWMVTNHDIRVISRMHDIDPNLWFSMPVRVCEFIRCFDKGAGEGEPFTFELDTLKDITEYLL